MTGGWRVVAALAASGLVGCALLGGGDDRARLAVVVHQGFAERPPTAEPAARAANLVLDVTPSMAAASGAGVGRFVAARSAAARLVEALPGDVDVAVHALGVEVPERCGGALRTRTARAGATRAALLADLAALEPAGDASLALGLAALRERLAGAGALGGARIAVYTDLDDRCGGDLCAALDALADGGAQVDLVVFGDAAAPACVDRATRDTAAPAASPVPFEVTPVERPRRAVTGMGDGTAVAVPPGNARVVVALDPPLRLDDVPLLPGTTSRLTVLDFPALDPPVREWFWDLGGGTASEGGAEGQPDDS